MSENWRGWPLDAKRQLLKNLQNPKYQYRRDPAAFARDILNAHPVPYQDEILTDLVDRRREAVRGPHGLGKTTIAAWAVLWFVSVFDDAKVPTTASAWRQLTKFLWPEIHKWARRADWSRLGHAPDLLQLSLRRGATCEAFAVASDNPELIEGAHADHLLYVFDEAKAIADPIWDAAEGAFASGDCYALAISTPGDRAGRFYEIHRHAPGLEHWHARHVTLEEAIAAGRISPIWADQQKRQWGEGSPSYQARVLGNFPEQSEDALISLAWVEAARERELEPSGTPSGGLDVARTGVDDSALIIVRGPSVLSCTAWHGHDTMETTGRAQSSGVFLNVDVIGIGAGVYDRLHELNYPCAEINVGEAARDKEHFANLRSELSWNLRERFQNGEMDLTRLAPSDYERLCGELTALKFKYTSKGQIALEPKDEMKKRVGHSPDFADALMLAYARSPDQVGDLEQARLPTAESRWRDTTAVNTLGGGSRWRRDR